jgi:chorismate dehydratase
LNSLRIGCVKYLNARPLSRGWPGNLEFDHPSALCRRLANRELDVALVSSFEYLRNPVYRIVDDVSISSYGPVYSVVVAYSGDISEIEQIELDPASETSTNLLRCLLAERALIPSLSRNIGKMPMFQALHRARLLIGDQAVHFRQKHAGEFQFWDLGEQWKKLTGLPFVYALWLIRPEVTDAKSVAQRLRKLRDKNLASLDDLIEEAVAGVGLPAVASAKTVETSPRKELNREFLLRYFRKHLRFSFGKKEKQGLQCFADLCAKHGVLPARDRPFTLV